MKIEIDDHLIDHIAAALMILDDQGGIKRVNQAALTLLGFQSEDEIIDSPFGELIVSEQHRAFEGDYQSLIDDKLDQKIEVSLLHQDGFAIPVCLNGSVFLDPTTNRFRTIWTISPSDSESAISYPSEDNNYIKNVQWLHNQGRELLQLDHWSDIIDFTGHSLQEMLDRCIVLMLTNTDEETLKLEGIYGLDEGVLAQVWKITGGNLIGQLFPLNDQFRDANTKRKLFTYSGGLEKFALSQVPKSISRQITKLVGIEEIHTIGLEGNRGVSGCIYFFSLDPNLELDSSLIETYAFQVALALEKAKYAADLKASEQQFKTIFEYAPDGYFLSDLHGNFLAGNLAAENIIGFKREDLLGKNFLKTDLISTDQLPQAGKLIAQSLVGKSTGPNTFIFNRSDGTQVVAEVTTHPIRLNEKSVILGIARDVSKHQQTEKHLEKVHDTLTRVLEGIDAHVYVADMDTFEILYMNKKMIEDFGGDFTGRKCHEVFMYENMQCSRCTNDQLLDSRGNPGDVVVWEGENKKTKRWYRNYDRAIFWSDQRLVRMEIAVDITENMEASQALEESELRYRTLFETSHNALMTVEPPSWNFTSGNPAMIDLFKLKDEQHFLSFKPWELSPEFQPDGKSSKEKAQEMIQIAVEEGSHFFHWTHKRTTGEEFPATVQLTRVDLDDSYFLQATVRDITDQVQAKEKLLRQMDDLELINTLNMAANQGQSMREIRRILNQETKRIFNCNNTTIYLLNEDKSRLDVDLRFLDDNLKRRIEKIINKNIPDQFELSLTEDSIYKEIILSGTTQVLTGPELIQGLMTDYLYASSLPKIFKKSIAKLLPQIHKITRVESVVVAPLVTSGKLIGLVDISLPYILPEDEKERFETIAGQLSGIIQKICVEEKQESYLREIELIYTTLVEGSRIDEIDEICQYLTDKVHEVNPDSFVVASLYDPDLDGIRVRAIEGLGDLADRIINVLGVRPEEVLIKASDHHLDDSLADLYTSGKLERIPDGLYDLAWRTIPRQLCKSAERLAGVSDVYTVGFGLGGKSTGGLMIFLKEEAEVQYAQAIEAIVKHFAVIFERRMAQDEIIHRKAQLEALRDIELEITSRLNLDEVLQTIAENASALVNAAATGFSIYNPERNVLEYLAYAGFDTLPESSDIEIGKGLSGKVWEEQKTIVVENYAGWEDRLANWEKIGEYYLAGIPVAWGSEILGVLEIALDLEESLSAPDIEVLELFAAQAAIAVKNAQLFSGEKLRRQEAETLREIGMIINRMMDRPNLLELILTALNKFIPYNSASIQLVKGSELVIEAFLGTEHPENVVGTIYNLNSDQIAYLILYEGKIVVLENREEIEELLHGPEIEKIQSFLAVPLEIKGNRIGILTLESYLPGQYTQHHADLAIDFAHQAAIAIENNRLFDEVRRRTQEIEAVYESALNLTQELQPEALFDHLHNQVESLFDPDAYLLATYDPADDMIQIAYATEGGLRQNQAEQLSISPQEKNSLLSWIIRKKTPLLIGNVDTDSLPVRAHQEGETIKSWLGVPLLVGERVIGGLVVQSFRAKAYTHNHRRLLQLLGNQVAIALENSRLFEDAQKRLSRITSLREIDQAISGSIDLELTMDVLIGQLIQTLEVDAACALAYKPDQQTLDYVTAQGFLTNSLQYTSLRLGSGLAGKAALERSLVFIPDLAAQETSFKQSPQFKREGFVSYFANPLIAKGELVGVLEVFHRKQINPDPEWISYLDSLTDLAAIAIDRLNLFNDLAKSNIDLRQAYDATIEGWARAIELRDGDTEGHSRRVVALTLNLARMMGLKEDQLDNIRRGALLHDIGKMAVPDGILLKPGKLTEEEWRVMKKHPVYAYDMLSNIEYLTDALDIPYCHHERWDGTGYPRGLAGESIPLAARIFSVVDVWDALQTDRPYREAWSEKKAISYIKEQSGTQFDPEVVKVFFELIGK